MMQGRRRFDWRLDGLRWLVALAAMHAVLALPVRPDAVDPSAFFVLPVELPLLLAVLLAAPPGARRAARIAVSVLLALVLAMKLADLAMFGALGRAFNPVLDFGLALYGIDLLVRAFGAAGAAALLAAGAVALALAIALLAWSTSVPAAVSQRRRAAFGLAAISALLLALDLTGAGRATTVSAGRFVAAHVAEYAGGFADLDRFVAEVAVDPVADIPDDRLLAGLGEADVMIVFVESYGRSVVVSGARDDEVSAALADLNATLARQGFGARSAWLTSPVRGGQSWLAHATLLSGLWVANQRRYDHLVAGARATLVRDFARAGWRTAAVMPAITYAWPPAGYYGYDAFYDAHGLGYRGPALGYMTMPDQYTLAAFAERELGPGRARPVMAELALISSHAPWTPLPEVVAWPEIGDGAVFAPYAEQGPSAEEVWRNAGRVRTQYRRSVAYVLRSLSAFVTKRAAATPDRPLVIIVVGDHQAVPFVAGDPEVYDVPLHVLASDPALLSALDGDGWHAGLLPDPEAAAWRMDEFRRQMIDAFTPSVALPADRSNGPG